MYAPTDALPTRRLNRRIIIYLLIVSIISIGILSRPTHARRQIIEFWQVGTSIRSSAAHEASNTEANKAGPRQLKSSLSTGEASKDRLSAPESLHQGDLSGIGNSCPNAPDSSNVFVILKTGASELASKLPAHLLTLQSCLKHDQLMILSDLEDTYAGHMIHDALQNVSRIWKDSNDDLAMYTEIQKARMEGSALDKLGGEGGWNLDKWKFLPMTFYAYDNAPAAVEWFFFIEADTSVSWSNLLLWLKTFNPEEEHYLGSPSWVGSDSFAHGGSGFVLSRPALAKLAQHRKAEGPSHYDARWEEVTSGHIYGDLVLALALLEVGIDVEDAYPILSPEKLHTIDLTEQSLCQPVGTSHHVDGVEISDLWRVQMEWVAEHGWNEQYTRRHVFAQLAGDLDWAARPDWDNLSESRKLIAYDEATAEEVGADWFVKHRAMNRAERAAVENADACEAACTDRGKCMQWKWRPGRCYLGDTLRLGRRDTETDVVTWTSGWHQERVEGLLERVEGCSVG